MIIAKIENGQIGQIMDHSIMFANTSFPLTGPSADFLIENNLVQVKNYIPFDSSVQKSVITEPYLAEDGFAYTVKVFDKSQEDLDAELAEWRASSVVSMRQARLALSRQGLLDAVNTAINNMQGAEGQEAQITWDFATEVRRTDSLVQSLATVLNLTDDQLDQLFITASQL